MNAKLRDTTLAKRRQRGVTGEDLYLAQPLHAKNARRYDYKGEHLSISELCKKYGQALQLTESVVNVRVNQCGWSITDALETPIREKSSKMYEIEGVAKSLRGWAIHYNIPYDFLISRIRDQGLPIAEAVLSPYAPQCTDTFQVRVNSQKYELYGATFTLSELADMSGIQRKTLAARIKVGLSVQEAVEKPVKKAKK